VRYDDLRFTDHALERMEQRGLSKDDVRRVCTYGSKRRTGGKSDHTNGVSFQFRSVRVITNRKETVVITVVDKDQENDE